LRGKTGFQGLDKIFPKRELGPGSGATLHRMRTSVPTQVVVRDAVLHPAVQGSMSGITSWPSREGESPFEPCPHLSGSNKFTRRNRWDRRAFPGLPFVQRGAKARWAALGSPQAAFQLAVFCLAGVTKLFVAVPLFAAAAAAAAIDLIYLPLTLAGNRLLHHERHLPAS
jgi:hypothetical protein